MDVISFETLVIALPGGFGGALTTTPLRIGTNPTTNLPNPVEVPDGDPK